MGPTPHPSTPSLTISSVVSFVPKRVELDIEDFGSAKSPLFRTSQLPLDIHKLHAGDGGRLWSGFVSGGGSIYSVHLFFGNKASAAARASVLRALSSIHRAH